MALMTVNDRAVQVSADPDTPLLWVLREELDLTLKDPDKNGGRTVDALVTHVTNDPLVLWAWAPGNGRQPTPGTHAVFVALFRAWADSGAACLRMVG